jgi:hypothetical protein
MLAGGLYERTSGAAGQPLAGYQRRDPERTVLHELVARYAQTMLAEVRAADPEGGGLPRHVERELTEYLRCGVLAHGFARVRRATCHDEIVVAFSCKRRGLCPSCTARRMADTAAHLVDHVLPRAPYRQWVFTVPKALRLRLARDPAWTTWVGNLAVRAIGAWQRRIARQRGIRAPRTGAITFVQRFGGLVNLNVHFHLLVPDGVFADDDDQLAFALHPVPTSADVLAILDRIARRLADEVRDDNMEQDVDVLAQVQAEAAATWRSPQNGKPTVRGQKGRGLLRSCDFYTRSHTRPFRGFEEVASSWLRLLGARRPGRDTGDPGRRSARHLKACDNGPRTTTAAATSRRVPPAPSRQSASNTARGRARSARLLIRSRSPPSTYARRRRRRRPDIGRAIFVEPVSYLIEITFHEENNVCPYLTSC